MSSFSGSNFDNLVRVSLQSALRPVEPPPAAWDLIESQLEMEPQGSPRYPALRGMVGALHRFAVRVDRLLISSPGLHDRLTERRMQLITEILACPGTQHMSLAFA